MHSWEVSPKVELSKGGFTMTIEAGVNRTSATGAELTHFIKQLKELGGWSDVPVRAAPVANRASVTVPPGGCNRFSMLELD